MTKPSALLLAAAGIALAACGSPSASGTEAAATPAAAAAPSGWVEADLSAATPKLPLVVKAPAGYTLAKSPLGDVEIASEKATFDVDDVTALGPDALAQKEADVKANSGMTFEKMVLTQPDGFIAQMGGGNYIPVRMVAVGGKKYQFSVIPLFALQSEDDARQVFDLAAQAKAK